MSDDTPGAIPATDEQPPTESRTNPVEVSIPLSDRQAATLAQMLLARQQADRELVIYAGAIIAGSDYDRGVFVAVRAAENGSPAALVLKV